MERLWRSILKLESLKLLPILSAQQNGYLNEILMPNLGLFGLVIGLSFVLVENPGC